MENKNKNPYPKLFLSYCYSNLHSRDREYLPHYIKKTQLLKSLQHRLQSPPLKSNPGTICYLKFATTTMSDVQQQCIKFKITAADVLMYDFADVLGNLDTRVLITFSNRSQVLVLRLVYRLYTRLSDEHKKVISMDKNVENPMQH